MRKILLLSTLFIFSGLNPSDQDPMDLSSNLPSKINIRPLKVPLLVRDPKDPFKFV